MCQEIKIFVQKKSRIKKERGCYFMNIEIRTDKNIQNSDRLISYIREELNQEFQRHSERITNF